MKKIGHTLKLLRQSKGLSQREVSEGVMDFSYYNRVENDKVNISFSKLLHLLESLDISIEEFMFLNERNEAGNKKDLHKIIVETYYSSDVKMLIELEKMCAKEFLETKKVSFRHLFILCKLMSANIAKEKLEQKYIDEVTNYLNSLSYYTKNDVRMLAEFYDVLPTGMVFYLFDKMFISKKMYSAFETSKQGILLFHFNVIDLAIKEEKYGLAKKILEITKKEFNNPLDLLAKVICNYYDGLFIILSGKDREKGIKFAEETIRLLEKCNLKYPAQEHKECLDKIRAKMHLS